MNCERCRGACCETLTVGIDTSQLPPDTARWVRLHASSYDTEQTTFAAPCTELDAVGRCRIYADRPDICRNFAVGSRDCLKTVRLRRTALDYQQIRDEGDPLVLTVANA